MKARSSSRAISARCIDTPPSRCDCPCPAASQGWSRLRATSRSSRDARTRAQDEVRGALGLPPRATGKPLVLISFGGYGVAGLDTQALDDLKDYTIATTDSPASNNAIQPTSGLLYISEQQLYDSGLRYEDLVRGADVVVTKPGYGIISEAIANGAALLYTSRGQFVEYDVLVREMPRYLRVAVHRTGGLAARELE